MPGSYIDQQKKLMSMFKHILSFMPLCVSFLFGQADNPLSARTMALGHTYSLSAHDIDFFSNPVMIAELQTFHTAISWAHQLDNDAAFGISGAIPSRLGVFGISYFRYKITDLTTYNSIGQRAGTFSFTSSYFTMCYSNEIMENLYFGLNISFKDNVIYGDVISSYDPNLAIATYYPFILSRGVVEYLKVGFLIREINSQAGLDYTLINENKFIIGAHTLVCNINLSYYENDFGKSGSAYALGLEYILNILKFRIGYNSNQKYMAETVSFGLGLNISFFQVDYGYAGYTKYSLIEPVHKVSLGASF